MIKSFLLGFIAGAATIWVYRDCIADAVDTRTRVMRTGLARRLRVAADTLDRGIAGAPGRATPEGIAGDEGSTEPAGLPVGS